MLDPVWSLNGVTLSGRDQPRLDSVSLQIPSGVTAVMGASGAGKSSLLSLLSEFEQPDYGTIGIEHSKAMPSGALPLFWSPQDHGLWPHLTVQQHVDYVLPDRAERTTSGRSATQWLELFGLDQLQISLPDSLSQGERSRLAVVRALASEAAVLVLDEPLVHVDSLTAHRCWRVINEHIQRHCSAVVFSTHDADAVLRYAQHVICLENGNVTFSDSVESLFNQPPTEELAWLLGPYNWLLPSDIAKNDAAPEDPDRDFCCVRPSQLELRRDAGGQFTVESVLRAASTTEIRLGDRTAERTLDVFVSRLPSDVRTGDTVQIIVDPSEPRTE